MWAVYHLVIMKSLMDCPASHLCDIFTSAILQTTDFCGARTKATIKTTNLRQWHGTICIAKVFLLSEREISPNYTGIVLDFVHGFGSYVKGLPKTKRCNSFAVTVSVRFRFGFGVYVKRPLAETISAVLSILWYSSKNVNCDTFYLGIMTRFLFRLPIIVQKYNGNGSWGIFSCCKSLKYSFVKLYGVWQGILAIILYNCIKRPKF